MSNKTWETLFKLSNFMKYLASDVIPHEGSPPSAYVLNSLFDLLNVTLQTIQVIKKKVPDSSISGQKFFHEQLESHASKGLRSFQAGNSNPNKIDVREESPTQKNQSKADETVISSPAGTSTGAENYAHIVGPKKNLNKNGVAYDNERRGSQTSDEVVLTPRNASALSGDLTSKSLHSVETNLGKREKPKTGLILKKNFIFLNEQVFSGGKTFGAFCLPCDKCFFDIEDWNSHSESDPVHLERITKGNYEGIVCQKCAFIVFGSFAIGSVFFDYHCKLHTDNEPNVEKSGVDKNNAKSDDFQNKGTLKESFINFNYKVHTEGIKESFFCHPCAQFGFDAPEWKNHMFSRNHLQRMANPIFKNVEAICDYCSLRCVNLNKIVDPCMSHHALGHSRPLSYTIHPVDHNMYQDLLNQGGFFEFLEPQACQDSKGTPQQQNEADHNEKHAKNDNICKSLLTKSFIRFVKKVHSKKIWDAFYCQPCERFFKIPSKWESHLSCLLHLRRTANQKLIKAKCDQCNFTCILRKKAVAACMDHHYLRHNRTSNTSREQLTGSTYQQEELDPLDPDICNLPLTEAFIRFDKKVHLKKIRDAFYCHPCEKFFEVPSIWESHLSGKHHLKITANQKLVEVVLCEQCNFTCILLEKNVATCMNHHYLGHNPTSNSFRKQLTGSTYQQDELDPLKPDSELNQSNKLLPEHKRCKKIFLDFHRYLLLKGFEGAFFCYPCQTFGFRPSDWKYHSSDKSHVLKMNKRTLKALCSYCSLTFVGRKNFVEQYMSFHSVSHEQPMSITWDRALPKTLEQESTLEQSNASTSETYSRDCTPTAGNPQQPETASSEQNPADIINSYI